MMKGKTFQIGHLFAILVEKNAELPEDHKGRKFKGRVVRVRRIGCGRPGQEPRAIPGALQLPCYDAGQQSCRHVRTV
eukprot:4028667-Pyramimonas_sp.AAC.1